MKPQKDVVHGWNDAAAEVLLHGDSENSRSRKRKRPDVDKTDSDPKLQEFLEVMQPPSKSRTWANEDSARAQSASKPAARNPQQEAAAVQSDEEYEAVPKNSKSFHKSKDMNVSANSMETAPDTNGNGDARDHSGQARHGDDVEPIPEKEPEPPGHTVPAASDDDWLRSRTSRLLGLVDDDDNDDALEARPLLQTGAESPKDPVVPKQPQERGTSDAGVQTDEDSHKPDAPISEQNFTGIENTGASTGRLFIRNLMYTTAEHELREHFEAQNYGPIEEVST